MLKISSLLLCTVFVFCCCKPHKKEILIVENIKKHKINNQHEYNSLVNKDFEKFDIIRFNKNKEDGETYRHNNTNGDEIIESGGFENGEHIVEIFPKNSLFTISKVFYSNSNIKDKVPSFNDSCEIGIWYEFDEKG
jgi:hypothetical protein